MRWDVCPFQSTTLRQMTKVLLSAYLRYQPLLTNHYAQYQRVGECWQPNIWSDAQMLLVFLYEDPSKYDPENVLAGLLCGLSLVWDFKFHCDVSQQPCQCFHAHQDITKNVKKQPSQDVLQGDTAEKELGLACLVSSCTLPHQNSQPGRRGWQTACSKVLSRCARDTW